MITLALGLLYGFVGVLGVSFIARLVKLYNIS